MNYRRLADKARLEIDEHLRVLLDAEKYHAVSKLLDKYAITLMASTMLTHTKENRDG